ncbi:MAG: AtpZ/AtpI family protein [bacterium]|nr:AtpZ/AtpI family protein [bacterium]
MKQQVWWLPAILLTTKLSAWIIGPVIIGLFVGKWLDNKYHSEPWLFLLSMGVAFIFSMFGLVKNALNEYKKIEVIDKELLKK